MLTPSEIHGLREAATQSFKDFAPFREQNKQFIRYYLGRQYSKDECEDPVPLPQFKLMVATLGAYLAPGDPQTLVVAKPGGHKAEALDIESNINYQMRKDDTGTLLRNAVEDALFLMGTVKTGITGIGYTDDDGTPRNAPEIYQRRVSFDNLIVDSRAGDNEGYAFIGDRYSMSLRKAQSMPNFDVNVRAKLGTGDYRESWLDGGKASERTDGLSTDKDKASDDFEPMVELVDIYIPSRRIIVTLAAADETLAPLAQTPYDGPNEGPYLHLSFGRVPDNFMPLSPMAALYELHTLGNALWVKCTKQGRGQKTVFGVQGMSEEDAKRAIAAPDRAVIPVQSAQGIATMAFPGVDGPTLALALQANELFGSQLFNLKALAGLGPQSQTVGQDKLIAEQANKVVEDMAKATMKFSQKLIRARAWHIFNDPVRIYESTRKIKGTRLETRAVFSPELAHADFFGYNYEVDPYSMKTKTPSEHWNNIVALLQTFAPFMQQMTAQGVGFKFDELVRLYARYSGMSELEDIVVFMNPQQPSQDQEGPTKSPTSHRVYERVNRPGATQEGANKVMISQLMSGGRSPLAGAA